MNTLTVCGLESVLKELGLKTPIPQCPATNLLINPLDISRSYIVDIIRSVVNCDETVANKSTHRPNNIYDGDFTVVIPKLGENTSNKDMAIDITRRFPECPLFRLPFFEGVHLRILFQPRILPRFILPYIHDRKEAYGIDSSLGMSDVSSPHSSQKTVVVEFSSPNIAQDFQLKHLRSTILGLHVAKLFECMGWKVIRLNYLGDWGKPMGLLGVGWERFGDEEQFHQNPTAHLLNVYHQIDKLFAPETVNSKKARDEGRDPAEIESQGIFAERNTHFSKLETGDSEAVALWKRVRDTHVEHYKNLFTRLNVNFDEYSGESQVKPETMAEVEETLKSRGLLEEKGGAFIIDLKKHTGKPGIAIIRDRGGSSTYLLRDLAAVLERSRKYSFNKMVYVVAAGKHNTHFSRLFNILELMDMADLASKLQHLSFSDGAKSGADDLQYSLEGILDQCRSLTLASLKANEEKATLFAEAGQDCENIGINSLIIQELSVKRGHDHSLNFDRIASFDVGTGLDLQYWRARLNLILKDKPKSDSLSREEPNYLEQEDQVNLLRTLIQYPTITSTAYQTLEPVTISAYLFNITEQLSVLFKSDPASTPLSEDKRSFIEAVQTVLENGMKLLGISKLPSVS